MLKYCIAMVDIIRREPAFMGCTTPTVFFLGDRNAGTETWRSSITDDKVKWFNTKLEAKYSLLNPNECIIAWNVVTEKEMDRWLADENYTMPNYKYPLPGMSSFFEAFDKIDRMRSKNNQPPAVVPDMKAKPGHGSKYDAMLRDFIQSGNKKIVVKTPEGIRDSAVVRGLKDFILKNRYPARVYQKDKITYLERVEDQQEKKSSEHVFRGEVRLTGSFA